MSKCILFIKIIVSLLTLWLLSYFVNWRETFTVLRDVDFVFAFIALVIFWVAQFISALRFLYIVRVLHGKINYMKSVIVHFIGLWFNQFLPSSLGGDILKFALLTRSIGTGISFRACILDRLSGFIFLLFAIFITFPLYSKILPEQWMTTGIAAISFGFLITLISLAWYFSHLRRKHFTGKPRFLKFTQLFADIWLFRRLTYLIPQFWTSAVVHFNGIFSYVLIGLSLGVDVNIVDFILIVPLIFLLSLIPISFAGWGVREMSAIWFFNSVGIPKSKALAMSLAFGCFLIISALPGLVLTFLFKREKENEQRL